MENWIEGERVDKRVGKDLPADYYIKYIERRYNE